MSHGVGTIIKRKNTLTFIPKREVPFATKKVTYGRIVFDIRPNKSETHRSRLTVCGIFLDYEESLSTPTATIINTKGVVNNIVSTTNGKELCLYTNKSILKIHFPVPNI